MTGCNADQEWMLKWWWKHYKKHNDYPVTFSDFGMSAGARKWCEERGTLLPFNPQSINLKMETAAAWGDKIGISTWSKRAIWFAKALILEETPYEKTVWTDIDCEILKPLTPLFELAESKDGFAIAYDNEENTRLAKKCRMIEDNVRVLQVGVLAFKKTSPVIPAWIDYCLKNLDSELSEQSALSNLQAKSLFDITILSNKYNWLKPENPSPHTVINHHTGASRKRKLLAEIQFNG